MSDTAANGKPLSHYEPYVDMIAQVLANGLALATEPAFLMTLDRSLPLHEALRETAREQIKWRFAWAIDEIKEPT